MIIKSSTSSGTNERESYATDAAKRMRLNLRIANIYT